MSVPDIRRTLVNRASVRSQGRYVLYWMIANRRPKWNFSLDRAVEWANELKKPLIVFEALRIGYEWASDRLHTFILQGMHANARVFDETAVTYFPYVEEEHGQGAGLLERLAADACVVITDDFPCFFLPRMVAAAGKKIDVCFESIDSNGLLPMKAADRVFSRAYDFRRHLQKHLPQHFADRPWKDPLDHCDDLPSIEVDESILKKWPAATQDQLAAEPEFLQSLPIDHDVSPTDTKGGHDAAQRQLRDFLKNKLPDYGEKRNEPENDVTSGLSPYLHFGHISVHQVADELAKIEDWRPEHVSDKTSGAREGWWNMSPTAEAFLDEIITWREVGYNMAHNTDDFDQYRSLPDWARETLDDHASDPREFTYDLEQFESAQTHDPLWNAAQNQLRREGRIHNYLRMLWGKKILHWSKSPQDALEIMIELNNKYALDGRNPNSYSGIFWVLGRYDRPWGPKRPIFGSIRYMTSENTAKKYNVENYIQRYS